MIDSLCRPPRPPTDFRRSSSILSSRAKIGHGGMGSGDRSLLGRGERGSHYVLPSPPTPPNPFTPAAASGMRCDDPRLGGGMLFEVPRPVVPRNQAASFFIPIPQCVRSRLAQHRDGRGSYPAEHRHSRDRWADGDELSLGTLGRRRRRQAGFDVKADHRGAASLIDDAAAPLTVTRRSHLLRIRVQTPPCISR